MGDSLKQAALDTGPIIHLNQINSLHLLEIFEEVLITETVLDELAEYKIPQDLEEMNYQKKNADQNKYNLDPGESTALETAKKEEAIFITDDLEARQKSRELGIETHGSIGIIAINQQKGKLTLEKAVEKMRQLQKESALFTTDQILEQAIRKLEERQ
ncbi:MAG: nucleic acid-binding protein [Candidatus Nanohaloarchaea archaeon]